MTLSEVKCIKNSPKSLGAMLNCMRGTPNRCYRSMSKFINTHLSSMTFVL